MSVGCCPLSVVNPIRFIRRYDNALAETINLFSETRNLLHESLNEIALVLECRGKTIAAVKLFPHIFLKCFSNHIPV